MTANFDWDITVAEVLTFVGFAPSAANANPASAAITTYINEFAGLVNAELYGLTATRPAAAVFSSTVNPETYYAARGVILRRCAAEWFVANQRKMNDYAEHLINTYEEYLRALRNRPSYLLSDQGHGTSVTSGSAYALGETMSDQVNRAKTKPWIDDGGFS